MPRLQLICGGLRRGLPGRFAQARSGQVALTVGLMMLPFLFAAGAAIDYGRRNAAKTQLDSAVDGAVLALISKKTNSITAQDLANAEAQFRGEAAKLTGVTVTSFTPTAVTNASTLTLSARYTANVRTTLGSMMNVQNLAVGGMSGAQRNLFQYIDFYLLLDNSPSMGLAATDADVTNMKRVTGGCAFGCHKHTFDSRGNITGDETNDNYQIAKRNNIKLRIQVLRDAVMSLVDKAKGSMTLAQQFRMEVWTFSDIQTRITALTANLDQVKTEATQIDLAYSLYGEPDNQTAYERAMTKMTGTIPAGGTGVTSASPIKFLFFVTDGVQDTPIDGSVSNPSAGYRINGNRFISPINPANCQAMKDKGIRIGIIYTTYLPLYDNDFYNSYVKPFETKIPTTLKACASDGLFFPVTSGGDITEAMLKLFATALSSVRITN